MITLEIRVNGEFVEKISAVNVEPAHMGECKNPCLFMHKYIVNGTYAIEHARVDGYRKLAMLMLKAIKEK